MLLEVEELVTEFRTRGGALRAVDRVSFGLDRGETLGIVGESGSGKSAIAQSIMRLVQPPGRIAGGRIRLDGEDLLALPEAAMRRLRGARIAMVFQDPTSTLNPVLTVGEQIAELLRCHRGLGRRAARAQGITMLERVGIPAAATRYDSFPHELSGGMQQRVIIACALILHPELVIADEPTTALDVTVQAQILDLLRRLQDSERGTAIILITHNLGIVAELCERVAVVYAGRIVEIGPVRRILEAPRHPYTAGLIASIPRLDGGDGGELQPIPGTVADPLRPPPGCRFHPRCPRAFERCLSEAPPAHAQPDGAVACHLYDPAR
jgi:peptide/nickel transport system ATP-binding protein/oligopeptide transport system ATP-binding protein